MERTRKFTVKCPSNLTIRVFDAGTGALQRIEKYHNLTTNDGCNMIRDFMNSGSALQLTHFAVGTGAAPTEASTTLNTEVFRAALTSKTPAAKALTCLYLLGAGSANGNTLTECGILTAAAGGTLYCATDMTPIVKTASIYCTFSWVLGWVGV